MPRLISIGELIDKSWESYRGSFGSYLGISAWILIVAALSVIGLAFYPAASKLLLLSPDYTGSEMFGVILLYVSSGIVAPLLGFWILNVLVRFAGANEADGRADVKKAMREARTLFFPSILVHFLVGLLLFSALIITLGPSFLVGWIASLIDNRPLALISLILLFFGMIAGLVLEIRWVVRYFLSPYAILLEDKRGRSALSRSRELTEGKFLSVVLRILAPKLVYFLAGIAALAFIYAISGVAIAAAAGMNADVELRLATMVKTVFPMLVAALLHPPMVIADVLLFNSLRENKS